MTKCSIPSDFKIKKIGRIHDKRTDTYLDIVRFSLPGKKTKELQLPPSVVADHVVFGKKLRDAGAFLPSVGLKDLLQGVAHTKPLTEWTYEAHTGWTADRKTFVLIDEALGENEEMVLGVNLNNSISDLTGRTSRRGTWKSWRVSAAKLAGYSSLLMCGTCAAFAAPLLSVTGQDSFGICIFGPTRKGKSVATTLPASVIGIGRKDQLITWNITDARLEERLPEFNDSVFPIDDFENLRERDRYLRVRGLAYRMAQGQGTARHTSFVQRHGGVHMQWKSVILTSSEYSIQELARRTNAERQGGEAVRLIDLPAITRECDHIFDRAPLNCDSPGWRASTFKKIALACATNHGEAYMHYLRRLLAMGDSLSSYVQQRIDFFLRRVTDELDGELSRDIARKFALLYAGGMLARRFHLVEWSKADLLSAISECYVRAKSLLRDDGVVLREGLLLLNKKLQSFPTWTHETKDQFDVEFCESIDGLKRPREGHKLHLIKGDSFDAIFDSLDQTRLVEDWLLKGGMITPSRKNEGAREAKCQHSWPDGRRRRGLEIRWHRNFLSRESII